VRILGHETLRDADLPGRPAAAQLREYGVELLVPLTTDRIRIALKSRRVEQGASGGRERIVDLDQDLDVDVDLELDGDVTAT
jgi:hypothetical protein